MEAENRGPELVAAATLFFVLSLIAVSLRCYVRAVMLRAFGVDDGLSLCSMATFVVYCAFFFQAINLGAGRHVTDVSDENMALILKCRWFGELFYVISSVLVKYSIGITLLRIIVARWQKATVWILLALVLVFNIFLALVVIFQCRPVEHFWMRILGVTTGTCLSKSLVSTATYLSCSFNILGDCILGFLPIALVWTMSLKPREKFVVAVVLSLGSIACTATTVRTFYVWQLTDSIDPTIGFVDIAIWSTVENGLALTASSTAILRPLARKVFRRYGLFGHTSNYQEPYSRELSSRSRPCFTGCGLRRDAGRHQRGMHGVPDSNDGESVDCRRESE